MATEATTAAAVSFVRWGQTDPVGDGTDVQTGVDLLNAYQAARGEESIVDPETLDEDSDEAQANAIRFYDASASAFREAYLSGQFSDEEKQGIGQALIVTVATAEGVPDFLAEMIAMTAPPEGIEKVVNDPSWSVASFLGSDSDEDTGAEDEDSDVFADLLGPDLGTVD